ncbi:MAG: GNAT family N-acetyltransferase [Allorhizobium sp.]
MTEITLRRATGDDIAFVMTTERTPGYDAFVGQFSEAVHRSTLADPACAYLIGCDGTGRPIGFAILWHLDDQAGNVCIKRLAVSSPENGAGSALVRLVIDWVFRQTPAYRLWLRVIAGNDRAQHVYTKLGFQQEGVLRQTSLMPDGTRTDMIVMSMLRPEWQACR